MSPDPRHHIPGPVLLGAQPRSGTTLLSSILRATPGHLQAFELHIRKPSFVVGLDGRYTRNIMRDVGLPEEAYDAILAETDTVGMNLGAWTGPIEAVSAEPSTGAETTAFHSELCARGRLVSRLMEAAAAAVGASTWGFKVLGDIIHAEAYAQAFPHARMLVEVRDPRDQIASLQKLNTQRAERGQPPFYADVRSAAVGWVETYRDGLTATTRAGLDHMVLRYEDLVTQPAHATSAVGEWLGLPVTEGLAFQDREFVARHQARFAHHGNLGRSVSARSVGTWRTALTPEDVEVVIDVAGDLMSRFGYE